jgi:hypothetical protein
VKRESRFSAIHKNAFEISECNIGCRQDESKLGKKAIAVIIG